MLARLQAALFTFFFLASVVYSREEVLFTSSVTYCNPPETLLIQQLDVIYFASNQSVSFNISAASVQANVNVTANLFLNVYGLNPVNYTIDLCSIFNGALCPLPMYNFTGADTLSLPKSLGVAGRIPTIAYKIPDLEGFAQLTLTEVGTGKVRACVQATLSNGWSTHQPAVEWLTGAFALAASLLAIWKSFSPGSLGPFLLLDLFYLYQTIATTALLNLNYPSVYRSFTLNFAWAMGFFPSTEIQSSINRMRHMTGGSLADSSTGSAISLVNRKLSPYNADAQTLVARATRSALRLISPVVNKIYLGTADFSTSDQGEVQTVTASSSNVLQAGVPIYVNSLNISTANAFMTIFFVIMMLTAILLAVLSLIYLILFIFTKRQNPKKRSFWIELLEDYPCYVRAWVLRLCLIILLPTLIFVFYQWTLKDSWLSILLSVFTFLGVLALVIYPVISTLRLALNFYPSSIYSERRFYAAHGPLYARYRVSRFYFFAPTLLAILLKSIFVAFAKDRGDVQVAGIIAIEGLLLLSLCLLRPFRTRSEDVFSIIQAAVRFLCTSLLVAFLESLNVNAIKRVVFGFIVIVIFSLAVLVAFARIVIELLSGSVKLPFPRSASSSPNQLNQSGSAGTIEKTKSSDSWDPEQGLGRPINPTPDHAVPLERGLSPYNFSAVASPEPSIGPCTSRRDSGTMTVGSLLPSRWSVSLSPPGSPASSSAHHHSYLRTMSQLSSLPHTPATTASHYSDEQSELHQHSSHGH
ncbi:hypothetical protein M378DRAFT_104287 [Amanita muscaria Koide BX008]|uniref:ML-like domain-containing protein n=1 Tax=Amanita muscaria (strain Koide BX008) TaxID=946122 RepID=A0A0C2SRB2_AMAMK|nr:hypothetical protein M378DRAFT_104287 [Amanita muscaria Koide BX008]